MATKAKLEGNKRYLSKFDDVKIRVPEGKREDIKRYAIENGYAGIQPYIKALIEKDSRIDLS